VGSTVLRRGSLLSTAVLLLLLASSAFPVGSAAYSQSRVNRPYGACEKAGHGDLECLALRVPTVATASPDAIGPAFEGSGEKGGFSPADLRSAYKFPETGGSGRTIAIVDAYNDPNAYSDLATYRSTYKLSECTEASGCFKKVNQKGETKNYPVANTEWSEEISLDLDMVSAVCPGCHILLVEAETSSPANLGTAENKAATLGASVISDSFGGKEVEGEAKEYGSDFKHAGIPITVASGDSGYGVEFPAGSPNVISVGGTALKKEEKSTRGWSEEVWRNTEFKVGEKGAGTGGGCALKEETKLAWQKDKSCANRTDNDVAAVASTSTPVSVYDSYETTESTRWRNMGGTSAAAPIVAGLEGLAESSARKQGAEVFYRQPETTFDVTKGSNGECGGSYLCTAGTGYDGPTGMGSPDGVPRVLAVAEGSSPVVTHDSSGNQWVYYVNSNHEIAFWAYNASAGVWGAGVLGGSVAAETSPAIVRAASTGDQFVYYHGSNGAIWFWDYNAAAGVWGDAELGGKVSTDTSPTAVRNETTGDQFVYYVGAEEAIWTWNYNAAAAKWGDAELGGKAAGDTSPTVVRASTGDQFVYYTGANEAVWFWNYNAAAAKWGDVELGGKAEPGSSPTAVRNESTGDQFIYYVGLNEAIWTWNYNAGAAKWGDAELGGKVEGDTSPAVVRATSTGDQFVYYVGSNEAIWFWDYNAAAAKWGDNELGGKVAFASRPSAFRNETTGDQFVYYLNSADQVWLWDYNASAAVWGDSEL
jgi:hypothetical protein